MGDELCFVTAGSNAKVTILLNFKQYLNSQAWRLKAQALKACRGILGWWNTSLLIGLCALLRSNKLRILSSPYSFLSGTEHMVFI